ncbi:P-loop containing nucleoside triphosphate hydrolase protein [Kockovaella imperatae]|uniref:p-loop containing nucleoside triphosphate hydrolase protein n=1 Tax=Kockovaella imperatae TaxID=4999 RepID=A0A1Y1UJ11_9TREE|nr:P-loop containing nucleoside triphosphate hydrolase protein [Kockovaella imperatae]ORX37959.1 P-loop containing nucleoside triphosphate hydrolase protein [Kockovaella imperatae]
MPIKLRHQKPFWLAAIEQPKQFDLFIITELMAAIFILALCLAYAFTRSIANHKSLTYHIANLSGVYSVYWYFASLGQDLAVGHERDITWHQYTSLAFGIAIAVSIIIVPTGPPLYQDLSKLYTKAVTEKIHETGINDPKIPNVNAEANASILSKAIFHFVYPTIAKTSKMDQADLQDLPAAHAYFRTQNVLHESVVVNDQSGVRLSKYPTLGLLWTVWRPERARISHVPTVLLIEVILGPIYYLPHLCTQQILWLIDNGSIRSNLYAYAGLFTASRLLLSILQYKAYNYSTLYASPRINCHSAFLLYQKLLTRNTYASPSPTLDSKIKSVHKKADILNLISSDSSALARLGWTVARMIKFQVEMVIGCLFVWYLLGPSGLWGLLTLLLTYPPAYFLTKLQYRIYETQLEIKDEKVSLMQEAIQAISMIKMTATEIVWYRRIMSVREREIAKITQARLVGYLSGILYDISPTLVVLVAFAHYTLVAKKTLTASIAFTSIGVFDELRPALVQLPTNIAVLLQEILSAKRIATFLGTQDIEYMLDSPADGQPVPQAKSLFVRGTITWDVPASTALQPDADSLAPTPPFQLRDLDVKFPRGEMTLIAGKFGSGKTLLLLSLLGEVRLLNGEISYAVSPLMDPLNDGEQDWSLVLGGVAYVPRTAWLQSQSIRDNILFGLPMKEERYKAVVFAVGLLPDLALLDDGDLTEIGERGKILSGGQKARVSLARAIYSRASILVLDDIISAVDAQTSKHIIQECFQSDLTAGRTIILASHAVESIAPLAENAIFLHEGKASWQGTGPELLKSEHMLHLKTSGAAEATPEETIIDETTSTLFGTCTEYVVKPRNAKTPKELVIEEQRSKGNVGVEHWWKLKRANGGNVFWTMMTVLLLVSGLAPVAERGVLERWTNGAKNLNETHTLVFWVSLYTALSLSKVLLETLFGLFRFYGGMHALRKIHSTMLDKMLRAKMTFFSKTRAGSIIQRFGTDLFDITSCSELMGETAEIILGIIISTASITLAAGWSFAVSILLLFMIVWKPSTWYRSSSRQIRRLQSVIPGPINAHYGESVAGAAVIRAFGVQSIFVNELLQMLNMKINVNAWSWYIGRWLAINLRLMDIVTMSSALGLIITSSDMTGSRAGFILIFASGITYSVQWIMMNLRSFELHGVSLERVAEYENLDTEDIDSLEQDGDSRPEDSRPDGQYAGGSELAYWPDVGAIHIKDLCARYGADMPDILHDVSFEVRGGERIGISFFSFVDVPKGKIEIDGKNIYDLPVGLVRSRLGIISQDPILLSGTLRLNLDVYGQFTDAELYGALHNVQLLKDSPDQSEISETSDSSSATAVESEEDQLNIFANLNTEIKSGGENLSAGQKQLVVLARPLLQRHKVLILDEATASIDSATDGEISRVVHEEFQGVTILIIAHRLRTIMPCSKVIVMDQGRLIQQGSPFELIKQSGKFQSLCQAAGQEEYRQLTSLAEESAAALDL